MNIGVMIPSLRGGGAERAAINLTGALASRGHRVSLIVGNLSGPLTSSVTEGVAVLDLGARRMTGAIPRLAQTLRRDRYDAVVAAMTNSGFAAVAARQLSGLHPAILIWEQNNLSSTLASLPRWRSRVVERQVRWSYPRADVVAGVSLGVARDVRKVVGRNLGVDVLHNPVVTEDLLRRACDVPTGPLWERLSDSKIVLGVGRLTAQKNFALLVRAFAKGAPEDGELVILGDGPDRDALVELATSLDIGHRVHLPGFVKDVPAWLAHSRLFVLSSRWEGLPTVLIEALACGIPVVSTDCPSGPREILDGGAHGQLVPPSDIAALATALSDNLTGPRVAAEAGAVAPYTPIETARRIEELISG